ncbi:MAG: glycosyltransferase [Vicinamibacteria bacterium]
MRILLIAPYPVLPPSTGGKIRIVRIAEALVDLGIEVTVLTPFKPGQKRHRRDVAFELRQVVYPFLLPFLLTDRPFPFMYLVSHHPWFGRSMQSWLRTFDLVQFEHVAFADLLHRLAPGQPVVYDAHNVEFDYVRQECGSEWTRRIAGDRIRGLERILVDESSLVLTCSTEDRNRLGELYGLAQEKVLIIQNGIHSPVSPMNGTATDPPWSDRVARLPRKAMFSGSDVAHNRQAVAFIVQQLAPLLRQTCGFIIQGECGRRFLNQGGDNVDFDPHWNTFRQYARPGVVGLNPVVQGSGSNLKLAHYLAHGMPVLSTEFGVRGFMDVAPFVHVRALEAFAEALRSERFEPPNAGAHLARLSWGALAARLRDSYLQLIERAQSPAKK